MVLDTDLGSDVDDALALAVLLGSPELDLLGAVTVYGPVIQRARLAAGFAALAGRRLTVRAGTAEPLSGRPVWVSGEEGRHFPNLGTEPIATDGVAWLLEQARQAAGELEIVAIGPLTNLARAIRADPAFATAVRRVWLMGGLFAAQPPAVQPPAAPAAGRPGEQAEHNFSSDAVAADEVLRSGMPITVLGLEVTRQLRLAQPQIAELGSFGALGVQLERETRAWTAYWNESYDVPHDATTVIAMLRPDLFSYRAASVRVVPDGALAGRVVEDEIDPVGTRPVGTRPVGIRPGGVRPGGVRPGGVRPGGAGPGGQVTVVTGLDVPAVTREILDRIRLACQGEPCAT